MSPVAENDPDRIPLEDTLVGDAQGVNFELFKREGKESHRRDYVH